jgi:pyrroloquinoline quinone biosynthesis protein E
MSSAGERLRLASKARLVRDRRTGQEVLLYPERGLALSAVAAAIVRALDGTRTEEEIAGEVAASFVGAKLDEVASDVRAFVGQLDARGLIERTVDARPPAADLTPQPPSPSLRSGEGGSEASRDAVAAPYTLIAELTYRCPLRCPYCSNPTTVADTGELTTAEWSRVFAEAAALGVMQVHLSGGEPLARRDLEQLVAAARAAGLYTNLITSGVPLTRERLAALRAAGVDHVQLSIQDADPAAADRVAGYPSFAHKLDVAAWIKDAGLPLTVNVVLHAANIERVPAVVALAERLGADRLELANTQYLGWALENRAALLPAREQLDRAFAAASAARERLLGRMEIVHVTPDYWADRPRACMDGWARRYLHVTPSGLALPCHAAHTLPVRFDNVRDHDLAWIWRESPGMALYRGDAWMKDPCRTCPQKHADFGGCRCQAFHLAGDAALADPACTLSPAHGIVAAARLRASAPREAEPRYLYRTAPARLP